MKAPSTYRALRYNRVSKDRKKEGASCDQQDAAGLAVVRREGWIDAGAIEDNDKGASQYSRGKRLGWQDVMDLILAKKIDVLVVWEISRSTRDRTVWAALVAACQEARVRLCVGGKLYDLDDPDDAFTLDLQSALGIREAGVTRKRVNRSVQSSAGDGKPHGQIPYGYERIYHPTTRALVRQQPHPERAAIVREIFARIAADYPLSTFARELDERKIPTPRGASEWGTATLRAIALSPTYLGLRTHNGEVREGTWPALVSEAQHAAVAAVLSGPRRAKSRPGAARWLLTRIGTCGSCGSPWNARPARGTGSALYSCSGSRGCCSSRLDWLDAFVVGTVCDRLAEPDFRDALLAGDGEDVALAAAELKALQDRLASFCAEAADGAISSASFRTIEARLLPQIAAAKVRAKGNGAVPSVVRDLIAGAPDREEVARRFADDLDLAQQKAALRALIEELTLLPKDGPRGARPDGLDLDRVTLRFRDWGRAA